MEDRGDRQARKKEPTTPEGVVVNGEKEALMVFGNCVLWELPHLTKIRKTDIKSKRKYSIHKAPRDRLTDREREIPRQSAPHGYPD